MEMFWKKFCVLMAVTLYQMKEQLAAMNEELRNVGEDLARMSADPSTKMDVLREKKQRMEDLRERSSILKGQIDAAEANARDGLGAGGAKMTMAEAKGRFYKAALTGGDMSMVAQTAGQMLGAITTESDAQGHGERLMPTNLSSELLVEPLVENPLSAHMTRTQITGLVVQPFDFEIDDDDFVVDGATAKELALGSGDPITFGRNKLKLVATVSETVVEGSDYNIGAVVDSALKSALANKELKLLFDANPAAAVAHMSLYANNGIATVNGETMLDAILGAYGSLEDFYRPHAVCVMRAVDYMAMIRTLNGDGDLYGRKPQEILGFPVVFCEKATTPVVGDFRFLHENFDIAGKYETDKNVRTGMHEFVLTNWIDIRIKMAAAFRKAAVTA